MIIKFNIHYTPAEWENRTNFILVEESGKPSINFEVHHLPGTNNYTIVVYNILPFQIRVKNFQCAKSCINAIKKLLVTNFLEFS